MYYLSYNILPKSIYVCSCKFSICYGYILRLILVVIKNIVTEVMKLLAIVMLVKY